MGGALTGAFEVLLEFLDVHLQLPGEQGRRVDRQGPVARLERFYCYFAQQARGLHVTNELRIVEP